MELKNVLTANLKSPNGKTFTVQRAKSFNEKDSDVRHEDVLVIRPGYLVCISFRNEIIPHITLNEGFAEILSVKAGEKVFTKPSDICHALLWPKKGPGRYRLGVVKEPVAI